MRIVVPLLSVLCILSLFFAGPASAGSEPADMVEGLYAPFLGQAPAQGSDLELFHPMAAPSLKELLEKEMACWEQGDAICKYDFSIIVDGQDYELTDFRIEEQHPSPDTVEVSALFNNFGQPQHVVYLFAKAGAGWELTDVQTRGEYPMSLVKLLQ